jgi:putative transcriptional regulator
MKTAIAQHARNIGAAFRAWLAAVAVGLALSAAPVAAQTIGNGTLLVASPELTDANFARAVVLVLRHDENGTIGVMLNRPTNLLPGVVFPELVENLGTYDGKLFRGGPIAPTRLLYLVRGLAAAAVNGPEVLEKVFLSIDDASLPDMVRLADGTDELRLYAGHAAWVPGQLQAEVGAGGWQILRATPELVFHADPGTLWKELEGRGSDGNNLVAGEPGATRPSSMTCAPAKSGYSVFLSIASVVSSGSDWPSASGNTSVLDGWLSPPAPTGTYKNRPSCDHAAQQ